MTVEQPTDNEYLNPVWSPVCAPHEKLIDCETSRHFCSTEDGTVQFLGHRFQLVTQSSKRNGERRDFSSTRLTRWSMVPSQRGGHASRCDGVDVYGQY